MKIDLPLVSAIITSKNEGKNIGNCMFSIKRQTYSNIEVILVDNGSIDKTKEIARKYTNKIYSKGPERSAQRNFGVKKASGEYILYLDADMILESNLISECVKQIQETSSDALYIPEVVMGDSLFLTVRRFERSFYDATAIDCVRFIEKNAFIKVGGFDLDLTGPEDFDLDKKLKQAGYKFSLLKNSHINHNEKDMKLREYLDKKYYYTASFDTYIKKWGKDDEDVKKQLGIWYRFFVIFTENGKWKKLIKHPFLTVSMYNLRILVGLMYLKRRNAA